MKMKTIFILPFLALPLLSGCNSSHKISLVYGKMSDNSLTVIDYATLVTKIESNKDTFILTVAPKSNCACWNTFKNILAAYSTKTHVNIYNMVNTEFYNADSVQLNTYGMSIRQDRETFAIFENGKLAQHRVYDSKDYIFTESVQFEKYMEDVVNLPTMFEISLNQLQNIQASKEDALVYFARNNCPDCTYVDTHYLKEYGENHLDMKPLYILDCEKLGIRVYDENNQLTPESQIAWQTFKDTYGLSKLYNDKYGYDNGYVPTFQHIKGNDGSYASSIVSSSVYFNDTISEEDGKYVVTNSFYTEERKVNLDYLEGINTPVLKGLELSENDVSKIEYKGNIYLSWKKESAEKYHSALLKGFLDKHLPLVSHNF